MSLTLSVVLGGAGVILLLAGLLGGGFTFSGSVVPTVGSRARVGCLVVGVLLLVLALFIGLVEAGSKMAEGRSADPPSSAPTAAPAAAESAGYPATVLVPAGQAAFVYTDPVTTATTVGQLYSGVSIYLFCSVQGEYVVDSRGVASSLWYRTETGYVPDVHLNTGTTQSVTGPC